MAATLKEAFYISYLKMSGFVLLVIFLYLFASALGGIAFGLYYFIIYAIRGTILDPQIMQDLVLQNLALVSVAGAVLALGFLWLLFLIRRESLVKYTLIKRTTAPSLGAALFMGTGIYLALYGFLVISNLYRYFPDHQEIMNHLVMGSSFPLVLISVGLVIPLIEEVAYRGIIFNRLRESLPVGPALIIQALIFGAVHLNVLQSSYAFLGGIFLGLAYLWSGSLWVPVLVHAGWNTTSVIMARKIQMEPSETNMAACLLIGAVLLAVTMFYLKKNRHQQDNKPFTTTF